MDNSVLWSAVEDENLYTARLLIERGYDVDEHRFGTSCLLKAIKTCNLEMVKLLLNAGAAIDSTDHRGYELLHAAIQISYDKKRWRMLKLLLDYNVLQKSSSNHGLTYVHEAVRADDFDSVQLSLDAGAQLNSNHCTVQGAPGNPLHTAIKFLEGKARYNMVAKLIKVGANVDSRDCEGITCLHPAIRFGDPSEAWQLIELPLDAEAQTKCMSDKEISPLAVAVKTKDYQLSEK